MVLGTCSGYGDGIRNPVEIDAGAAGCGLRAAGWLAAGWLRSVCAVGEQTTRVVLG